MNWDRMDENWLEYTGTVNERWDNLTGHQLARRVQDTYGMTNGEDDPQHPLTDWQLRLNEIQRTGR